MTQEKRRVRDDPKLVQMFEGQAQACEKMKAPFNAGVCRWLADNLDEETALGRRILDWPKANRAGDLVALRCCAGFHALARAGRVSALRDVYPPNKTNDDALGRALAQALSEQDAFLAANCDSAPQTNEVGRSAILLGGVLTLVEKISLTVALHEIGASAGLNLLFDRWSYDLGEAGRWGVNEAPVTIACRWEGKSPATNTPFEIVRRAASDLNPLDPAKGEHRERLLSYIWPDERDRIERTGRALEVMAASGLKVEKEDAQSWFARVLSPDAAQDNTTTLLFHSLFIQYLDPPVREKLVADIARRGEAASTEKPFAWLRMEHAEQDRARCELRLKIWPGGEDTLLADVDWHGRWAKWV